MLQVARFKVGRRTRWGVVEGDGCVPLEGEYSTTGDLLTKGRDDIAAAKGEGGEGRVALADVELLSPITENQQVLCQGANYRQHMIEAGMDPDSKGFNMFFRKASSCLCGSERRDSKAGPRAAARL